MKDDQKDLDVSKALATSLAYTKKELKKTKWVEVDMSKSDDKSQASIQ